jgi:hypothetical protein
LTALGCNFGEQLVHRRLGDRRIIQGSVLVNDYQTHAKRLHQCKIMDNVDEVVLGDSAGSKANNDGGSAMLIDIRSRISEPIDSI